MSSPSELDRERMRAWDRHALAQERTSARIACVLIIALVPLWSVFDYWLEPEHAPLFLVIRVGVTLLGLAAFLIVRGSSGALVSRCAMIAVASTTGISIAFFISQIDAHFVLYSVGFSLVFWGFGPLLAWPWVYTAVCYALILGVHIALRLTVESTVDGTTFYGLFAYLASAAVVSTGASIARRRLEYQAFAASYELERKNRELGAALATLQDAQARFVATEKLSALGRLIAQLAHEINNPVNVLQNNLEPVREYLGDLEVVLDIAKRDGGSELIARWAELDIDFVRTDMKEAISTMIVAAERIRTIQSDLRSFMRGDQGLPTEADFNEGVRSTVAMLKRNVPANTTIVERYGELPAARFHAGQLNQVTMNLLQNALDAVGSSGTISIETSFDRDDLVLSVSDTGPGISADAKRHLFEPFFTTKAVGKGTGLGLATCYQIVNAHGGSITLDENSPTGTRFVVRLPARRS